MSTYKTPDGRSSGIQRIIHELTQDPNVTNPALTPGGLASPKDTGKSDLSTRYEIKRIQDELTNIYAQQPRVAKQVFTRILTEKEGM